MREILFKGKRLDNGEWVEGNLIRNDDGRVFIGHFYVTVREDGFYNIAAMIHEVDPETVGQFTGLTDKNGTKIFESDIVSTDLARPYLIVEFRDGCFMYNCNDGGEDYYDIMLPILKEPQTVDKYVEVIGNIHDGGK